MWKSLITILMILAMVVTSMAPVFAQDGSTHLYLPAAQNGDDAAGPSSSGTTPGGPQRFYLPFLADPDSADVPQPDVSQPDVPQPDVDNPLSRQPAKITHDDREDAAARALQAGALNPLMVDVPGVEVAVWTPGSAPHYFSHPNYANSPLPTAVGVTTPVGNDLVDRVQASGTQANVFVILQEPLPAGMLQSFQVWNQATAGPNGALSAGQRFHAYVLRPTTTASVYTVVFDSGQLTMAPLTTAGVSEVVTFAVANLAVKAGDLLAFYGQGIPFSATGGTDQVYYPSLALPLQNSTIEVGATIYPAFTADARTYSFGAQVLEPGGLTIEGGIQKFKDGLPGLGAGAANGLDQYISVATPDTASYPGSDYYEIAVVEYTKQLHSDLPATRLRGYVQLDPDGESLEDGVALLDPDDNTPILLPNGDPAVAVDPPQYLGAAIVAEKDRPVRVKFYNLLPAGAAGNLFIPVDSTVMGSGMTATGHEWMMMNPDMVDPLNPMCSGPMKSMMVADGRCYAENRATLHLHGGISPWISDGTPHQWITPAGETTAYPQGVSVKPVPDMGDSGDPNDGVMTFYYTNQQSARLMFYHDHAWGITRLNVYAGEAAPYIIQDATEQALVADGIIPGAADTIPLVVQDKTFVPNDAQLAWQDESWDTTRWGGEGSLWVPHVYSPAQNPGDASGVNEFGRWAYGPWFWPPTSSIEHGPVANTYYDAGCDPDAQWCEPPLMPGVPYNSMGMESFNDTPIVNGTAYPTLTVDPKAYRFRVLNAANDRFFNLSLYLAVDANGVLCDDNNPNPAPESTGVACTEVFLNPDEVAAALDDGTIHPTPVVGTEGPDWIAIGTEGGFLPSPVVIPAHPTTWVNDPTVFNAGNVDQHSLLTAPAERHDVIVDFSQFAGATLILYNDAPAAFPARDPRYDYYTGNGDYRDTGGASSTLPGYGPNTRTVMQIKVNAGPGQSFDLAALDNAFKSTAQGGMGVFQDGQHPIIVGQKEYNGALGTAFAGNEGLVQIYDTTLSFRNEADVPLTMNLQPKMIQDEMGEAFELEYGRMSGFLGVETPNAQAGLQNMILHGYTYPPTEILDGVELPPGVEVTPLASTDDGTQIWKITHNGVDTHPIHWHLYDVQLINRVGWDGIIRKPDLNELGWKDTVRVSPLEDTIVALRPIIPQLPPEWGGLPNSVRLLDPSMPEGHYLMGANTTQREAMGLPIMAFNPAGEPVDIVNHYVNFGWEYVYHCHILSHEEMDMMHAQGVGVAPPAPTEVAATRSGSQIHVTWVDNSRNETAFLIEQSPTADGPWSELVTVPSDSLDVGPGTGARAFDVAASQDPWLRVTAVNVVGDTWDYSNPELNEIAPGGGFPTLTLAAAAANVVEITVPPAAPTSLVATVQGSLADGPRVRLVFRDNALTETGFVVERSVNGGAFEWLAELPPRDNRGNVTYFDTPVVGGNTYVYRVYAFNAYNSGYSNEAIASIPPGPAAPSNFTGTTRTTNGGTLARVDTTWTDNADNETRFVIQRADNDAFTGAVSFNRAADVTAFNNTGLPISTIYYYRIRAENPYGKSEWVNLSPFPIQTAPPAIP